MQEDVTIATTTVTEATVPFDDRDQVRSVFGTRDAHLRQLRDALGVDVVYRDGEVRVRGEPERVGRAVEALSELRTIVQHSGHLDAREVDRVLRLGTAERNRQARAAAFELLRHTPEIRPRTPGQLKYVEAIRDHEVVFCTGPAGCGKTYLAVAMAVNAMRQEQVRKIVLVRPAVEAGEKLGFLPGDIFAKVNPYLRPLLDALGDMLGYEQVRQYIDKDVIEIVPLAFMRGRTLNHTYIILDEAQNTTVTQMKMFLTRMGEGSRVVVTGDVTQLDLPQHVHSGLIDAVQRLANIPGVAVVHLGKEDIVRHRLVARIVHAYEKDQETTRGKKRR